MKRKGILLTAMILALMMLGQNTAVMSNVYGAENSSGDEVSILNSSDISETGRRNLANSETDAQESSKESENFGNKSLVKGNLGAGSVSDTAAPGKVITETNGNGTITLSKAAPKAGETVIVTAQAGDGYYLAQIRIEIRTLSAEDETTSSFETLDVAGSKASFNMPELSSNESLVVWADFISIVWDGTIDLTWYDEDADTYKIKYPAQLAGAATLNNGLFNDIPTREVTDDGKNVKIPDTVDESGNAIGLDDDSVIGTVASDDESDYQTFADIDGDGIDTTVVGDLSMIKIGHSSGEVGSNMRVTTQTYWYGMTYYTGKTIMLMNDLDMGGVCDDGALKTKLSSWSGPNYMPLGGQYSMDRYNGYTRLSVGFNGTLDGNGYMIRNLFMNRHADTFGNCQGVGVVGILGMFHTEDGEVTAPKVCNLAVDGFVYGNRSVGAIVGKTAHTNSRGAVIENCINFATVYNTDAKGCGGIIGAAWHDSSYGDGVAKIYTCANMGLISTGYNKNAGGLVGSNESYVYDSYTIGYVCHDGKGDYDAAQSLGTNNGGAVWYNCYTIKGSSCGMSNNPGIVTPYVYGSTYGSAIRVMNSVSDIKNSVDLLNGRVIFSQVDGNGYMDSDDDVTPGTKRNWVAGKESAGMKFKSSHLAQSLESICSYHDPDTTFEDLSIAGIAEKLSQIDGTGLPVPRTFMNNVSQIKDIVSTGNPTKEYYTGETFDTGNKDNPSESPYDTDPDAAFAVWALFEDGTWQEIEDYTVTYPNGGTEFTTASDNTSITVNIDYLGVTKSFTIGEIKVTECQLLSMKVTKQPNNDFYAAGENFDPEGVVISESYGYNESGTSEEVMQIKAEYSNGSFEITKRVKQASGEYSNIILTGEAAESYSYTFDDMFGLAAGRDTIKVQHVFNGQTYTADINITVMDSKAPRLVKDGENNRQIVYITSSDDFLWFANQVATGIDSDMEAVLENDITLSGDSLLPVGVKKTSQVYSGDFDGRGHKITLKLNKKTNNAALFYCVGYDEDTERTGTVHDLVIDGDIGGKSYVAGIAAYVDGGIIRGCTNNADISASGAFSGGIAGIVRGAGSCITDCTNTGDISGYYDAGGIAGALASDSDDTSVMGCLNSGAVTLIDGNVTGVPNLSAKCVGGLAGASLNNSNEAAIAITQCANTGEVYDKSNDSTASTAGGIIGSIGRGILSESYNKGNVSAVGKAYEAGVAGNIDNTTIESCYNTGGVTLSDPTDAVGDDITGGIAAYTASRSAVRNCYTTGLINSGGASDTYIASIIGRAPSGDNITNNYALDSIGSTILPLIGSSKSDFVPGNENAQYISEEEIKSDDFAARLGDKYKTGCSENIPLAWEDVPEHTYPDKYTVEKKATVGKPGSKSKICTRCGHKESAVIPAIKENFTIKETTVIYNSKAQEPEVIIEDTAGNIIADSNYDIQYNHNVNAGTAELTVTFDSDDYEGTLSGKFTIRAAALTVELSDNTLEYTGKTLIPEIKVTGVDGKTLSEGTDYTVSYPDRSINISEYIINVSGMGNYTGVVSKNYNINPKGASIKSLKKGKKAFTVKWKKQTAKMPKSRITGYQVRYSTDASMNSSKIKTIKGYKKSSAKVNKLAKKKTYYVQLRTYIKISGKTYYSNWSGVKSVKTK